MNDQSDARPIRVFAPVVRPAIPLVYLDLNHYINLAKAARNRKPIPGYTELLDAAGSAAQDGRVLFPLSSQHLLENTLAIKDPKQRGHVADVMEDLSGFSYLLGRVSIFELELEAGLAHLMGEPQGEPHQLLGSSFGRGFGMVGGFHVRNQDGTDGAQALRDELGDTEFERLMLEMNLMGERMMLRGPTDEEAEILRARGWKPEEARASQVARVDLEVAKRDQLDSKPGGVDYRRGRLRDFISAHEVVGDWLDLYTRITLDRLKAGKQPFNPDEKNGRALFDAMPHLQVSISMKTHYHRNPLHRWTTNDIYDIDALSVAYAYCDVVYTDKAAANALHHASEIRDLNTYMPKDPFELAAWLDAVPKRATGDLMVPAGPTHLR